MNGGNLFDTLPESAPLHIVRSDGEVFEGGWEAVLDRDRFDVLRVVTYVSSPRFMSKLVEGFKKVEVVLGIDSFRALKGLADYFGVGAMKQFCELTDAQRDMVANGSLSLRFPVMSPIHSKVYILESSEMGHTRVVIGSGNATENALTKRGKRQYEELVVFDDETTMYEHMLARFYWLRENETVDYIGETIKDAWRERRAVLDFTNEEDVNLVLLGRCQSAESAEVFKAGKEDYDILLEMRESGNPEFCPADADRLSLVYSLKKNNADKFELATGKKLEKAAKAIVTTLAVEITSQPDEPLHGEYWTSIVHTDGKRVFYKAPFGAGADEQTLPKDAERIDCPDVEPEWLDSQLALVERFIGTYSRYTAHAVGRDYLTRVAECIIYAMMAPLLADVREEVYSSGESASFYQRIPLYLILGGESHCGKTWLMDFMHQLMCGRRLDAAACSFNHMKSPTRYGSNLKNAFSFGNRFPLMVDDAPSSLFKNMGSSSMIKQLVNERTLSSGGYAPIICTANASDFQPSSYLYGRIRYMQFDVPFVDEKTSREVAAAGISEFNTICAGLDGSFEACFLSKAAAMLASDIDLLGGCGDYLYVARQIIAGIYADAGRVMPDYMPKN